MKIPVFLYVVLMTALLAGCAGNGPTPLTPTVTETDRPSVTATITETLTPFPTATPTVTPGPSPTPPALPTPFHTSLLNPLDTPHTYVTDTCQYLQEKWASTNSAPGTVVMAIMFHSISSATTGDMISEEDFQALMQALHDKGFQAIKTDQLADFMEKNAKIPPRSVLLIADDRHARDYFDLFFRPYWDKYKWPVVNAWISTDQSSADLWQQQVNLEKEGWVDHQAHGVVHNITMGPGASDAFITSELQGSIDAFQKYFDKTPIAIIWPGGAFNHRATQIARQLGYRLGFTIAPRGPVMFNWVPLADAADPMRPSWLQDGYVNDPLLVLPRYWDTDAIKHLDAVIQIGKDAKAYALKNKATEKQYYDIVCAPTYGQIP